jgi:hypothetical protein
MSVTITVLQPTPMISPSANAFSTRLFHGLVAGALAMLLFHQTSLQLLYWCGLIQHPAFRLANVPPFNVPMIVSVTFWGALFGAILGILPRMPTRISTRGLINALFGVTMVWFVVRPIAGHGIAFDWHPHAMAASAFASLAWGYGVALIQPVLHPRCLLQRSRDWARHHHLAT